MYRLPNLTFLSLFRYECPLRVYSTHALPFFFTADFESRLEKVDTCLNDPMKSGSTVLNTHVACGVTYMISCTNPRFYEEPEMITPDGTGINIAERFLEW